MRKVSRPGYQTADEIEVLIALRQHKASTLPPGKTRQAILDEIARLRAEADLKRRDNVIAISAKRQIANRWRDRS